MKSIILSILIILPIFTFSGCSWWSVTPRTETVIDRVYIPEECPTFTHSLRISGSKYNVSKEYNQTMVITLLDPFLESLERNKLARQTFNNGVTESNKELLIPGTPETSNFERVQKRIFVARDCPKYVYKPVVKARKLTDKFSADNNTTYVVISLNNMVFSMEKHKLAKEVYNGHIDTINKKPFTEEMKSKFDGYMKITVDKINDTIAAIKGKAKDEAFDFAKEKAFGKEEE